MVRANFSIEATGKTLLQALLEAGHHYGSSHVIAGDMTTPNMNYRQLYMRSFILADKFSYPFAEEKYIGMLLPNALAAMVTFFSLQCLEKIPCMLNYSAGAGNVAHACRIASVKTILTSRQFIEKGKLEDLALVLEKEFRVIYLEDLRGHIGLLDKLKGVAKSFMPNRFLRAALAQNPQAPAVILYTSGSEGVPKGVALSHQNILANIAQVHDRLDLKPTDIVFNALPVFHSFGLTVGMLMPPLSGIKTFLYPSPLHYRIIPGMARKSGATIMLGTDTFYNGYLQYADAADFKNIWLAVAGAEKLKPRTAALWHEKFNTNIMEGYGVTEASPVLAVNTPDAQKSGTVGRLFPGIEYRLEKVEGIAEGGRLFVRGPNVMLGYLRADQPGSVQPLGHDGWYDTGDIVNVDAQGYISITGRAKRFAKIGGEMISLQAVEDLASAISHEKAHAALAMPDDRKGEQVILLTEDESLNKEALLAQARKMGLSEINVPKQIIFKTAIPRLGNGKIDYPALSKTL